MGENDKLEIDLSNRIKSIKENAYRLFIVNDRLLKRGIVVYRKKTLPIRAYAAR